MHMNEWSLVLFTLLVQASIGVLVLGVIAGNVNGAFASGKLFPLQAAVSCGLAGFGLLFSLTHLGTPLHAVFTILNIGSSWLSREVLLTGLYFLAVLSLTAKLFQKPGSSVRGLALLTAALGLAALVAMSKVYLLPTVPVWNSMATTFGFFGAALLSGSVITGLLTAILMRRAEVAGEGKMAVILCVSATAGLALQCIGLAFGVAASGSAYNPTLIERFAASSEGFCLMAFQLVLLIAGSVLFVWMTFATRSVKDSRMLVRLGVCALGCVLVGEMLGRLMFYGSYWRVGL